MKSLWLFLIVFIYVFGTLTSNIVSREMRARPYHTIISDGLSEHNLPRQMLPGHSLPSLRSPKPKQPIGLPDLKLHIP